MIKPEYEMKEYNYKHNYILTICWVIMGIFMLCLTVYVTKWFIEEGETIKNTILADICLIFISFVFFYEGWCCHIEGMVKYRFEHKGLRAMYQIGKPKFIPWDDFQEVCITYVPGERNGPPCIFCIKKGEKKNIFGVWETFNITKYRKIIRIRYTPELFEGLKERYPYEIVDYR